MAKTPLVHHHEDDRPWRAAATTIGVVAIVALVAILALRPWTNRALPFSGATLLHPAGPLPTSTIQR